jgi:S1-C subfamily serine protease
MLRVVVVVAALTVSAWAVDAGAEPLRKWSVGSWEVAQHDGYCMATSPSLMSGKTSLMFSIGGDGMLAALLANPTWQMKGSRVKEVAVSIDTGEAEGYPTKVVGPTIVAIALPADLIPGLQDGIHVTFQFERATYKFPLNYTRPGLAALQKCFQGATETGTTAQTPQQSAPAKRVSAGTGMFVSRGGHILTNAHVVDGCSTIRVTTDDGETVGAFIVARDAQNDLALIRTAVKPTLVAAFRSSAIKQGEAVGAYGFPLVPVLASAGNFAPGYVTATAGLEDDSRYMQISTPVQPGNSGGPLLDMAGNVVGVVSAKLNDLAVMRATKGNVPQNVNFALKETMARNFLESRNISVENGQSGPALDTTELAVRAGKISVLIRCDGEAAASGD